ncbi:uncharacterized protein EI97DRAFT_299478 [Westerdykella ornata]|uniref:Uncharacterized protein n=1 Tax=Westerdykella ornata TaxID=318751 RepID=A0A6A6JM99_WESOR|nr:uncharacterized protein EI97DRAFT_299478 [Westerdykella ornata]KAF2277622.1 hypothetical protein EI97DRAFT_299478 [Westerdykella ornata]
MSSTVRFLPKNLKFFNFNYSPGHTTFIIHHVVQDFYHPLYTVRQRAMKEREKKGLWWHVTVGPNTSRARVVRSWARRRLRNAFLDTLKEKGVDEDGIILKAAEGVGPHTTIKAMLEKGERVGITGSVKMHALSGIVPAKYVDVKRETDMVVDALLKGLEAELQKKNPPSLPNKKNQNSVQQQRTPKRPAPPNRPKSTVK